jgi:mannosylglycoprotein endo-beta-mannosidase
MRGWLVSIWWYIIALRHQVLGEKYGHDDEHDRCRSGTVAQRGPHEIHTGWKACRIATGNKPSDGCTAPSETFQVDTLPTTALLVLLKNGQISEAVKRNVTEKDIYYSTNLALFEDIESTERDYYTLLYELTIPFLFNASACDNRSFARQTLRIAGINYRATAYLDGNVLQEINNEGHPAGDGMFRRRSYHVTPGSRFNVLIEPPLNPGSINCTNGNGCSGQGGNHALAKDGATAQFMLGWDWCQAMPDRATGFYGSVTLEQSGFVAIRDPAVQTLSLTCEHDESNKGAECSNVVLRFLMHLECVGPACTSLESTDSVTIVADWGQSWTINYVLDSPELNLMSGEIMVKNLELVHLWWPHGVGRGDAPKLHSFTFTVKHRGKISDEKEIQVGIRTISTYVDEHVQGQTFKVNGERIYLVGGNWISTDQALRFSASTDRYCSEIKLHKQAGLNLIRVWAGATAERDQFYDCADQLGVLVFQEFWMSGDNNGRWEGNYSWPLDYGSYISNVRDTIQRLRPHASLLFYGGCNECLAPRDSPWFPNPPAEIDHSMRLLLEELDPGRFYIPSSMGGPNGADTFQDPKLWADRNYSLSYADGPYGMQLPVTFFERNPGLPFKNVSIGFQPEIGSTSAPTYRGLLRFMSEEEANGGVPAANGNAGATWNYHKYISWSTNSTYDHVYAYIGPNRTLNASEWCAAAQLAAHAQQQQLFNGFISFVFEYTSAVILWKSQSPWPAMRGFLYDWYLETTGALRGTQAALGQPVSVVLDSSTWRLRLVNRQVYQLTKTRSTSTLGARYSFISLRGEVLVTEDVPLDADALPSMSTSLLRKESLKWPVSCSDICFLRLQVLGAGAKGVSWYWLTNPALGNEPDYSALGEMRSQQAGEGILKVNSCTLIGSTMTMQLQILVPTHAKVLLFYPTFALYTQDNKPILPVFDTSEANIVILPGETHMRSLVSSAATRVIESGGSNMVRVEMASWNAPTVIVFAECDGSSGASPLHPEIS